MEDHGKSVRKPLTHENYTAMYSIHCRDYFKGKGQIYPSSFTKPQTYPCPNWNNEVFCTFLNNFTLENKIQI